MIDNTNELEIIIDRDAKDLFHELMGQLLEQDTDKNYFVSVKYLENVENLN